MFSAKLDGEVELRLLELRHTEELFALVDANRAYLREWLPWVEGTGNPDVVRAFIQSRLNDFAANRGFQAGIWRREQIVGVIGYHRINWANRSASIGYWLAESAQGAGIMTKACHAVVDHAFETLGLHRMEIRAATGNARSCAIPERLGFRKEGTIRQAEFLYDHFVDLAVYGMLAGEWAARDGSTGVPVR